MDKANRLLPCPFCGSAAKDPYSNGHTSCSAKWPTKCPLWRLECAIPVEVWNTRAGQPLTQDEVNVVIAELVEAIAPLAKESVMVYEVNERGKRIPVGEKLTQRAYDIGRLITKARAFTERTAAVQEA